MHKIEKLEHTQVDLIRGIGFSKPTEDIINKLNEVIDVVNEMTDKIGWLVSTYLED